MNDAVHDQTTPADADGDLGYLLTAYADGQLALDGMAWVEEQLDRRPELRARLKEIRGLQAALRVEFARFPAPTELGGFARGQVLDAAQRRRPSTLRHWALAALLVIGVSVSVMAVMVTMGESASTGTTSDEVTAYRGSVAAPAPAPPSAIPGLSGAADLVEVQEQRGGVDANMVAVDGDAGDASGAKGGEVAKAELDGKELTGSVAFMSIGAGGRASHARRSDRKLGAANPSTAPDLAMAEPGGQVEAGSKDDVSQRQAATLKKQDEDRGTTRSSALASGLSSPTTEKALTHQLAADQARPAPAVPTAATVAQPALAVADGRAGGRKRLAGADAVRAADLPAEPVAQAQRQVEGAPGLDHPAEPTGGVAYAKIAAAPAPPVADDAAGAEQVRLTSSALRFDSSKLQSDDAKAGVGAANGTAQPVLAAPPTSRPVSVAADERGSGKRVHEEIHKSLVPQHELPVYDDEPAPSDPFGFLQGAPAAPGQQAQAAPAPGNADKTHIAQVARGTAFQLNVKLGEVEDDLTSTAAALTQREEDLAKLTGQDNDAAARLGIVKERYPKVWNDVADQHQSAYFFQGTVSSVRNNPQGQSDLVMLTLGKADNIDEGTEFIVFRGSEYVVKVRAEKVLGDMVACRVIPESWNTNGAQIRIGDLAQNHLGGSEDVEKTRAPGEAATPSQSLAWGNAQRAPRDRVAALLATASVNATAPLASLLRTAAGPDGALAASPALDEVLARPTHLETHDLPSGQALLQLARGAGLQARVLGGVVTLDVARGQLDPTDTQGLDRAGFTKAFGTVPMVATADDARSTFALDANTASFERARAQLRAGQAPDPAAIQAEHFINAMPMDYPAAQGPEAFTLYAEAAPSPFALGPADAAARAPWAGRTAVVAIGAVARPAAPDERRPLHLTLALDCSGSMAQPGGLDRVRLGLEELLAHLRPIDTVAVVAFSDQARVVLPATPGGDPAPIARALAGLTPGGATNAVEGLALAYQLAAEHLEPGSENRVLFATDGGTLAGADAQVVIERVAAYKSRGISLLVVGCGGGAYQGRTLQQLADRAGGQHVFLGSDDEARSAFASRLLPERLAVLAKDAKVQVTWNPQRVSHFRLIGYEQRRLAHQDFRNDAVDAGEISHDTQVTALYEVLLVDGATGPLGSAAVRYFDTRLQQVRELSCPLAGAVLQAEPGQRLRLVACAAEFAAWLQRGWWSNVRPTTPARLLGELARCPQPQARELEELVQRAAALQPQPQPIPLNRNAGQSNTGNASAPAAPTDQAAPKP